LTTLVDVYREVWQPLAAAPPAEPLQEVVQKAEETADLEYLRENVPLAFDRTLEGIDRVAHIVRAMKEFAHPDQREKTPADINKAILNTLTVARNEYKYVADVDTDLGDLPAVTGYPNDLNQVFLNLVVNAAHAIGDIVRDIQTKGRISIATRAVDDGVEITIADTGGGIPEQISARIFDPFFTTKPVGKGTGQGLAIARSIVVDKHQGSLTFESRLGEGTTFHIRLPVRESA
jgi:signal transduction histidine kinase